MASCLMNIHTGQVLPPSNRVVAAVVVLGYLDGIERTFSEVAQQDGLT